jgi:maltooligosyltrehalose trehalohydrolase
MSDFVFGAHAHPGGVRFVVPASRTKRCEVRLFDARGKPVETRPMIERDPGVFAVEVEGLRPGARYRYVVDGDEVSDPFARFLPDGPHGPASVESLAHSFAHGALGFPEEGAPIYEIHVGTFTKGGTFRSAAERLPDLARLGFGAVELMPIAAFAGRRGWGYDGVAHYAPHAPYGSREDVAAFVDTAHGLCLCVLLDVVYNHFGPDGNYLGRLVPEAFTKRFSSPWGDSPDFANPVLRAYVLDNVRYWFEEFRFDGLRLDATHAIFDDSGKHVLSEIAQIARAMAPRRIVIAEDERNDAALVREHGLDAIWADDFHHALHAALTGERDGYYAAYTGSAEELARTIERGWLYCGEVYPPTGVSRGLPATDLRASSFVYCIQNHDQTGNRALGQRLNDLASLEAFTAASMLLLLLPMTPVVFMGQEWASTSPFLYFTDHEPQLGQQVTDGRRKEFAHFAAFADAHVRDRIPDPQAEQTFLRSTLDWAERSREPHAQVLAMYGTLLRLRRTDPVLRSTARAAMRAYAVGELLVVDRWLGDSRRKMVVNLTSSPGAFVLEPHWHSMLSTSVVDLQSGSFPAHTAALFGFEPPIEPAR